MMLEPSPPASTPSMMLCSKDLISSLAYGIKDLISSLANGIKDLIGSLANGIKDLISSLAYAMNIVTKEKKWQAPNV